jgi:L-histidine N-alpha-methyltransferase
MTTIALPQIIIQSESPVALAVREGLAAHRKSLPAWLFYDAAGSHLFDQITHLPEYYLTRTERAIFAANASEIIEKALQASGLSRLRIAELGAGSADKTRLLLQAAIEFQGTLFYEPLDVSASALHAARQRIEHEIPGVHVLPRVMDYTQGLDFYPAAAGERRMVLYIGSSIGNFEPHQAARILEIVRAGLEPGDTLLLGVDLQKDESTLLAAYDDAAGVTARFNLNMLARLNRELAADFDLEAFAHRAVWNPTESRIEMHLESLVAQRVQIPALDLELSFATGERIHTENSYKYAPGQVEAMLAETGFNPENSWTDERGWFAVWLARAQ